MSRLFRWCALYATVALAACTGLPPRAVDTAPAYELSGRVAARYQGRVFASALRWTHNDGGDEIWLTAPLGQTLAHLRAGPDGATLTAADRKQYRAASIESLTRSALGWRFPVSGLRYWVLGQAAPGMATGSTERDDAGRITRLEQDGMQVSFSYGGPQAARPSRLEVAAGEAEIRLVIDSLSTQQP